MNSTDPETGETDAVDPSEELSVVKEKTSNIRTRKTFLHFEINLFLSNQVESARKSAHTEP
jgi:hypothetical protein